MIIYGGVDTSLLSLMSLVFFEIISTRGRGFGDIRDIRDINLGTLETSSMK